MTIALYGGKFDPPHKGHLNVALQILKKIPDIQELWLIPAKTHQWRDIYASGKDRLAMLKTYQKCNPRIKASDIELKRKKPTTTIDTVRQLQKVYPQHQFFFIMGSDNVPSFDQWHEHKTLAKLIKFLIYPRPGYKTNKLPKYFAIVPGFTMTRTRYSSTTIRNLISKGKSVRNYITPGVATYIHRHNLYKNH